MSQRKTETDNMESKQAYYSNVYGFSDTAKMMESSDYRIRFIAEYVQLKIRYEKLKHLLTKWEAFGKRFKTDLNQPASEFMKEFTEWLGFQPSCSYDLLRDQQRQMGELLHTLEVRAAIEGIDLRSVAVRL